MEKEHVRRNFQSLIRLEAHRVLAPPGIGLGASKASSTVPNAPDDFLH